jgi:hypothetical protein
LPCWSKFFYKIANFDLLMPIKQHSQSATAFSCLICKFLSNRISSPRVQPMLTLPILFSGCSLTLYWSCELKSWPELNDGGAYKVSFPNMTMYTKASWTPNLYRVWPGLKYMTDESASRVFSVKTSSFLKIGCFSWSTTCEM